ncbi:MAG: tRNA (5-methylaminomethyl-2-thiouridine)(34)-methyltransferase MnmD [Thiolinea sp.]
MEEISSPHLSTGLNNTPYSTEFQDFYFSSQDGLQEARHVFLSGNQLPQRWQGRRSYTLAETGFGSGLNFLATWQCWRDDPQRCQRLHYLSIEKHPLPREALRNSLNNWPELGALRDELLANYPPLLTGLHRLSLADGRIQLTLCFMDVQTALHELVAEVDGWYLDGFAPARNPDMWSLTVMQGLARLSHPAAALATLPADRCAATCRQPALPSPKRPGFVRKREMSTACLTAASLLAAPVATPVQPARHQTHGNSPGDPEPVWPAARWPFTGGTRHTGHRAGAPCPASHRSLQATVPA